MDTLYGRLTIKHSIYKDAVSSGLGDQGLAVEIEHNDSNRAAQLAIAFGFRFYISEGVLSSYFDG